MDNMACMPRIYTRHPNSQPAPDREPSSLSAIFGNSEDAVKSAAIAASELASVMGLSRAYANHPDIKKLLLLLQKRLLGIAFILENKVDPSSAIAVATISPADVAGLDSCITYFSTGLPMTMKQVIAGENKAGSMIRLVTVFANRAKKQVRQLAEKDINYHLVSEFTTKLAQLLEILERKEYQHANLEEQYWG